MFFFHLYRHQVPNTKPITPQTVVKKLCPFAEPDRQGWLIREDKSLLVHAVHHNTARSRLEPAPYHHESPPLHAAAWARIDNRDELGQALSITRGELETICDTELIVRCYLKWGGDCIGHIIGDFAFVIFDILANTVYCGRDHMGVRPLYYWVNDDVFACTTSLSAFQGLESVPLAVETKWMAEYLTNLSMSFDKTPYTGIMKLPPSHSLTVTPSGSKLRKYHDLWDVKETRLRWSSDYVEAYREHLETAIRCRLDSDYPIGCELSGGVDSSTIAAFAAQFLRSDIVRLHTFAFAFADMEPEHILAVSRASRIVHNHVFTGKPEQDHERVLKLLGVPQEHANGSFHEPFYILAEKLGVRTLLSGFGGDEFVTTIHGDLALYELAVHGRLLELYHRSVGNGLTRLLRTIKMELRRLKTRNFSSIAYNKGLLSSYSARWPLQVVTEPWVERFDLKNRYMDIARFDAGYTDLKRFTLEKRWKPFVSVRMENGSLMALGRKIEYRWPLLDVRLVRFFLSVPSEENVFRGMGRYLHRRAIDGLVPDKVAWKQGKDMGNLSTDFQAMETESPTGLFFNLHPLLADIVDREKLTGQVEKISAAHESRQVKIQCSVNIGKVLALDAWLKQMDRDASGLDE